MCVFRHAVRYYLEDVGEVEGNLLFLACGFAFVVVFTCVCVCSGVPCIMF